MGGAARAVSDSASTRSGWTAASTIRRAAGKAAACGRPSARARRSTWKPARARPARCITSSCVRIRSRNEFARRSRLLRDCLFALSAGVARRQHGTTNGEWRTWGGDLGVTRYAPLDQINAANFNTLEVAWRFRTDNLGARPDFNLQTTPLMIERRALLHRRRASQRRRASTPRPASCCGCTGSRKANARELSSRRLSGRGVGYWTDGKGDERDLLRHDRLSAGRPRREDRRAAQGLRRQRRRRSEEGQRSGARSDRRRSGVERRAGRREERRHRRRRASRRHGAAQQGRTPRATSAATTRAPASGCGSSTPFRSPASSATTPGSKSRGRTPATPACGRRSRSTRSSASPTCPSRSRPATTSAAIGPGNNLFAREPGRASICRPASASGTSSSMHHPIWDYDIPCAPILVDITVDGQQDRGDRAADQAGLRRSCSIARPAQPVWPIEERPVEKGTLPREWYSPTQPFPTKPPPFERQGFTEDIRDRLHARAEGRRR